MSSVNFSSCPISLKKRRNVITSNKVKKSDVFSPGKSLFFLGNMMMSFLSCVTLTEQA